MAGNSVRGGVNVKGGKASLNLQSGYSVRARESNKIFAANLSYAIRGMHKHVLGAFASEALLSAIDATKHDSSRAAANWNLSIGHQGMNADLSPHDYNTSGTWGMIGQKLSGGSFRQTVVDFKMMHWGISIPKGGSIHQAEPGGLLHTTLGIGQANSAPNITLFNPILGDANPWREGYFHEGATYAQNAFGSTSGPFMAGLEGLAEKIGDGFIPWMIRDLDLQIKKATSEGRILKQ